MKRIFTFCLLILIAANIFADSGHWPDNTLGFKDGTQPRTYTANPNYRQDATSTSVAKSTIVAGQACDVYVLFEFSTFAKNVYLVYTTDGSSPTKINGTSVAGTHSKYTGGSPERNWFYATIPGQDAQKNIRYVFYISDSDLAFSWGRVAGDGYQTSWTEGNSFFEYRVHNVSKGTGGDWNTIGTWENGNIPNSDTAVVDIINGSTVNVNDNYEVNDLNINSGGIVTIATGKSLTVSGTLSNSNGTSGILIKSDATGTGNLIHNTSDIEGSIERYLATGKYHYVSPPVSYASFPFGNQSNFYNVYYYKESTASWVREQTILKTGRGYSVNPMSNQTVTFTDTFIASNTDVSISRASAAATDGYNLIGNPFTATIDLDDFYTDNSSIIDNNFFLWDESGGTPYATSDYAQYVSGSGGTAGDGGNEPTGDLLPGQGFMVEKTNTGTSNVTFETNIRKASSSSQFFAGENDKVQRCWINLINPDKKFYNEILFSFFEEASNEKGVYDGKKKRGNNDIALYSLIPSSEFEYAIQGLAPVKTSISRNIGYGISTEGKYQIAIKDLQNFDESIEIILEDKLENKMVNLREVSNYEFETVSGEIDDRFVVHFMNTTSALENDIKISSDIYAFEKSIYINSNSDARLVVTDMLGHQVYNNQKVTPGFNKIDLNVKPGAYIVNLIDHQNTITQKVILR